MPAAPLINGYRFSFASLEITAQIGATDTELFIDVDDIAYEESLEIEYRYGAARQPIGWTSGTYQPGEGVLQMGKSTFQQMVQKVGPGWLGIQLVMNVAYADIGEALVVDTVIGRISGASDAHSQGPSPLVTNVKLKLFTILRNGIPAVLNRVF